MESAYKVMLPSTSQKTEFELSIEQKPPIKDLKVGDPQALEISITNEQDESVGMVVVILSTPSCMDVNMNELEILKERRQIDNFEISPDKSTIILYWTYLASNWTQVVKMTRVRKYGGKTC